MKFLCVTDSKIPPLAFGKDAPDLVVIDGGYLGKVDFQKEINGNSSKLMHLSSISDRVPLVCGAITRSGGADRRSAVVAANGKILAVADELSPCGKPACSLPVAVSLPFGRVGIFVGSDVALPELFSFFSESACRVAIGVLARPFSQLPALVGAYAFLYGLPVIAVAGGYCCYSDGKITSVAEKAGQNEALLFPDSEYVSVCKKVRRLQGFTAVFSSTEKR